MTPSDTNKSRPTWGCSTELAPGDKARYRRTHYLVFLWVGTLAAVAIGLKRFELDFGVFNYAIAALPMILHAAFIVSYADFLLKADELTRRIQLEGMAVGFGAGLLAMLGYPVLEIVGAPEMDVGMVVMFMVLAAIVTIHRQQRRMLSGE